MPNLRSPGEINTGYLLDDDYDALDFQEVASIEGIELEGNQVITQAFTPEFLYLRLEDDENPLSVIRLKEFTLNGVDYLKVEMAFSFEKGKGYVVPLYEYAFLYLDQPIICDRTQTMPGSSKLWKKLNDRASSSAYEILVLNSNTNTTHVYNTRNYNDYDIWGLEQRLIDAFDINPDIVALDGFLTDEVANLENEDSDSTIEFENEEDFPEIPGIDPVLYDYLKKGKTRIKDRGHIRLIGQRREVA